MNLHHTAHKRIIGLTISGAMLSATFLPAYSSTGITADADNNSVFNIGDIRAATASVLAQSSLSEQGSANADMDSGNEVNIVDICIMKRYFITNGSSGTDNTVTAIKYSENYVELFNSAGVIVSASEATNVTVANGTYVTVNLPGEFDVSGSCTNGQLAVDCDKSIYSDGAVTVNLLGLTLSNTATSPVYVASIGDEFIISSKNGYTNTISDGTSYTNADGDSGAIYSCDDIKFKGKGTLNINGNCTDGIVCKNDIKLWNGTINVTAVDDGIRGKDSVRIGDPDSTDYSNLNISVTASGGDGIRSTNADDVTTSSKDYGMVKICGGTITIDSYGDGISGEQSVKIIGGSLNIDTYEGSTYKAGSSGWGEGNSNKTDISCKGIKAVGLFASDGTTYSSMGNIYITGGTIDIDSTDDCIHCAGDMTISGGSTTLASADDGVHSDKTLNLGTAGGANTDFGINVTYSYEGVEATTINILSGSTKVYSTDDGFNAAGGDGSSTANPGGGWGQGSTGSTGTIVMSGGYIYSRANGDGFDSNGNITVSGGTLLVCGPVSGGNGIFDYGDVGCSFTQTGGIIFGMGSSDMAVYPSGSYISASGTLSANSKIAVADSSNNALAVLTVPSDMSMSGLVIFSNASATSSNYSVYRGVTYSGTLDANGFGVGGTISGGTQMTTGGGNVNPWGDFRISSGKSPF